MEDKLLLNKKLRKVLDYVLNFNITKGTSPKKSYEYIYQFLTSNTTFDEDIFKTILGDENNNNYLNYKKMIIGIIITDFYEYMKNMEYNEIEISDTFLNNAENNSFQNLYKDIINPDILEEQEDSIDDEEDLINEDEFEFDDEADLDDEDEADLDEFTLNLIENGVSFDQIYELFQNDIDFAINMIDVHYAYTSFNDEQKGVIINDVIKNEEQYIFDIYNPLHIFERNELNKKYKNNIIEVNDILSMSLESSMVKNDYDIDKMLNDYGNGEKQNKYFLTKLALIFYKKVILNKKRYNNITDIELNYINLIENDYNNIDRIIDIIIKNKELFMEIIYSYDELFYNDYQQKLNDYSQMHELSKNKVLKKFNPVYAYDYIVLNIEKNIREKK